MSCSCNKQTENVKSSKLAPVNDSSMVAVIVEILNDISSMALIVVRVVSVTMLNFSD